MTKLPSSRLSDAAFYFLCAGYLVLVYLVMNFPDAYFNLDGEDSFVELSGAFALLVVSVILIKSAFTRKRRVQQKDRNFWLLIGAGVLFFWASGEEISWGQHMLGTTTPEWLAEINGQQETNIHNINKKFFDRWLERFIFLLAVTSAVLHFRGKQFFLGFRMPEAPLAMAFLLLPIYRKLHSIFEQDLWPLGLLVFLGYPVVAVMKKDKKIIFQSCLFVITGAVVWHFHHNNWQEIWGNEGNILHEVRETMFAYLCVVFAIYLHRDQKNGVEQPK